MLLQIHVGYKKPKTYVLTPSRKRLGKAVARKSQQGIAAENLKNPLITKSCWKGGTEGDKKISIR